MSESDIQALLLDIFRRLRRSGFTLGISELQSAYQAVENGWGAGGPEALRRVVRLLWCSSRQEVAEFEVIFSTALEASKKRFPKESETAEPSVEPPPAQEPIVEPPPDSDNPPPAAAAQPPEPAALPVQTPPQTPADEAGEALRTYWPVSRRAMVYTWRYLRRPVKDGPQDVLDVEATVERTARQGFFLAPVYDRRENNHAHLILFIDQGGSMAPFHRFTRDLVETACEESTIQQVEVAYFHNVPPPSVFRDPHLTAPLPLEGVIAECTPDTSVLLVSDAGAARGYRSMSRIRATTDFLVRLKRRTTLIAWLNPMPQRRWASTSAQLIARLAPMFQMDDDGFSNAVDVLRGQPLHPHR